MAARRVAARDMCQDERVNHDLPHTTIDAAPSSAPPSTTRLPSARRQDNPSPLGELTSDDAALVQAQEAPHGSK